MLLDGEPETAGQVPEGEADGATVVTIEGLAIGGALNPVQRAFLELGAFQCGFCTPGMVVRATALLARSPSPSEEEIVEEMEGNLCRCGGYSRIVRAIRRASQLAEGSSRGRA